MYQNIFASPILLDAYQGENWSSSYILSIAHKSKKQPQQNGDLIC